MHEWARWECKEVADFGREVEICFTNPNHSPDEDPEAFRQTVRKVRRTIQQGGTVICHCNAGVHRAPQLAAALISLIEDTSYEHGVPCLHDYAWLKMFCTHESSDVIMLSLFHIVSVTFWMLFLLSWFYNRHVWAIACNMQLSWMKWRSSAAKPSSTFRALVALNHPLVNASGIFLHVPVVCHDIPWISMVDQCWSHLIMHDHTEAPWSKAPCGTVQRLVQKLAAQLQGGLLRMGPTQHNSSRKQSSGNLGLHELSIGFYLMLYGQGMTGPTWANRHEATFLFAVFCYVLVLQTGRNPNIQIFPTRFKWVRNGSNMSQQIHAKNHVWLWWLCKVPIVFGGFLGPTRPCWNLWEVASPQRNSSIRWYQVCPDMRWQKKCAANTSAIFSLSSKYIQHVLNGSSHWCSMIFMSLLTPNDPYIPPLYNIWKYSMNVKMIQDVSKCVRYTATYHDGPPLMHAWCLQWSAMSMEFYGCLWYYMVFYSLPALRFQIQTPSNTHWIHMKLHEYTINIHQLPHITTIIHHIPP